MRVVDSHVHFWDLKMPIHSRAKLGDAVPEVFLPCHYHALKSSKHRLVHVEAMPNDSIAEVEWVVTLSDGPEAVVAFAQLEDTDSFSLLLEQFQKRSNQVKGVRQIINFDEKEKHRCWPGVTRDLLLDEAWKRNLLRLKQANLSFDLQCNPSQLALFCDWGESCASDLPTIVIDHMGLPQLETEDEKALWLSTLSRAARMPNVYVKLTMLTHLYKGGWRESRRKDVVSLVNKVVEMFPSRAMWGSNAPVDAVCGLSDKVSSEIWDEILGGKSEQTKNQIMAETAIKVYRLQ